MPTPVTVAKIEKKSVANIFLSLKFIPLFQSQRLSIIIQIDPLRHYLPAIGHGYWLLAAGFWLLNTVDGFCFCFVVFNSWIMNHFQEMTTNRSLSQKLDFFRDV